MGISNLEDVHYWIYSPGNNAVNWDDYYERGIMAIERNELGDLSAYSSKEEMRRQMQKAIDPTRSFTHSALETWQFVHEIEIGDVIIAKKGKHTIIGRGIVTSRYRYDKDAAGCKNIRSVKWTHRGEWEHPGEAVTKPLTDITMYGGYVADIKKIFSEDDIADIILQREEYTPEDFLSEAYITRQQYSDILDLLNIKRNIILQGAPGVGKTSIALSVARAMNRNVARISLGGVRDEADIRGHRKTYIGAMPGRIIEAIARSGSMNPLLVLDEVDKMASDVRGDPASALLEVLDSEQNCAFRDHYLEIPVDLSRVMFIMTANHIDAIPRPLLDRMELIELPSYTDEEKLHIAQQYLLPRERKASGLTASSLRVDESAIRAAIALYTRESGVRSLERQIAGMCRKAAMQIAGGSAKRVTVTEENLSAFLGTPRVTQEKIPEKDLVGVVNGLAWTEVGGEILPVEVGVMEGSGKVELTGNLGDVMQESCRAALSCLRQRTQALGIAPDFYKTKDIHIHFPEGAVPKDGPSAGIAIATAVLSALTGQAVHRDVAMTGEITLRGRVLPIGGLREKTMGALRAGVHTVILPKDNEKDLADIDPNVREKLRFVPVESVDAVFAEALVHPEPCAAGKVREDFFPVQEAGASGMLRV